MRHTSTIKAIRRFEEEVESRLTFEDARQAERVRNACVPLVVPDAPKQLRDCAQCRVETPDCYTACLRSVLMRGPLFGTCEAALTKHMQLSTTELRILELLRTGWYTREEIATQLGVNKNTLHNAMRRLLRGNMIKERRSGADHVYHILE